MEDGEYFQTLPENTIFILLRPGEAWGPAGEDIVSQGDDDDEDDDEDDDDDDDEDEDEDENDDEDEDDEEEKRVILAGRMSTGE